MHEKGLLIASIVVWLQDYSDGVKLVIYWPISPPTPYPIHKSHPQSSQNAPALGRLLDKEAGMNQQRSFMAFPVSLSVTLALFSEYENAIFVTYPAESVHLWWHVY